MGRRHVLAAGNADVAIAEIVGHDDEDVGFGAPGRVSRGGPHGQDQQGSEGGGAAHGRSPRSGITGRQGKRRWMGGGQQADSTRAKDSGSRALYTVPKAPWPRTPSSSKRPSFWSAPF